MLYAFLRILLAVMLGTSAMAQVTPDTSVVSMLGMIPECSVPCVMKDLFTEGGCAMTTASDLAQCACTNITMQLRLSACVQRSCAFTSQVDVTSFAGNLCAAYPKQSRVNELKSSAIVTIALTIPFLLLRLYARWLRSGRLYLDDGYAIIASVLLITVSAIILRMSMLGFGLHYWNIPAQNGVELLKLYYVCQMLYILVQVFSKVAILALFQRLFPGFIHYFQWSVRVMIVFMFTHGLVFLMLIIFQCRPINSIWDKTIDGKCLPTDVVIFTGAALSIVEDFIILLLPVHELWKLQMSNKKKLGIILLLSMASFASITSIIRLKYLVKYANTYDSTWDNVDVIKWSLIEILAACILGNLLPLRPLLEKMVPPMRSIFSWYTRSTSRKSSEKQTGTFGRFTWRKRFKPSSKSNLISTFDFTKFSVTSSLDWTKSEINEISPRTPSPPHDFVYEKNGDVSVHVPRRDVEPQIVSAEFSRDTPTPGFSPTQVSVTDSTGRASRNDSERGLMPGSRELGRERHVSGPWSYALGIFDRT